MKFFAILFFFTSLTWAQTSYIPSTRTLYEGGYQAFWGAELFQTSKVISPEGVTRDLNEDESFYRAQFDLGASYGLTHSLQAGVNARFRNHLGTISSNGEKETLVSSGIQSIGLSLQYAFKPIGSFRYALEGFYRHTPYTNEEISGNNNNTTLVLGDDGNESSIGMNFSYEVGNKNFLSSKVSYRRPGRDLSSEVFWQAEGALSWSYLALVGGVEGIYSLNNDPYALNERPNYNTGVSQIYNSQNRQTHGAYGGVNIALGKSWRVEFKASQILGGRSTDLGTSYGINLVRRVEEAPKSMVDANFKTYDVEANIIKVSEKKDLVQIDKGLDDDLKKGMVMDFFEFDYLGGNILIARGVIIATKSTTSVVKITQRFHKSKSIKEGLLGRVSLK